MTTYSRLEFFILHEEICHKCFGKNYKTKTKNIPDYLFYGYDFKKHQTHLIDKSIKGLIQKESGGSFSGRKLRDAKNAYNKGEEQFQFNEKTVSSLKRFLSVSNLQKCILEALAERTVSPEDYIPPSKIIRTRIDHKYEDFKFDLYVAHPFLSVKEDLEQLKILKSKTLTLLSILKEKWDIDSYYGPATKKIKIAKGYDPGVILRQQFKNLPYSRAYLFIFPYSEVTMNSVLLQVGWSIFAGRLSLIVYEDIEMLPSLLKKGEVLDHIRLRPFPGNEFDVQDVLDWIEAQKLFKLIKQ